MFVWLLNTIKTSENDIIGYILKHPHTNVCNNFLIPFGVDRDGKNIVYFV